MADEQTARAFYDGRPWLRHYDEGVAHRLDYPDATLAELFAESSARDPDRVALRFMGRSVSYGELERAATGIAAGLAARGVMPGDRVLLFFPNTPHFVASYYGALKAGAVVVPASPLDTAPELAHKVRDSGARAVLFLDLFYERVEPLLADAGIAVFVAGDLADYLPFVKRLLFPLRKRKLAPRLPELGARTVAFREFVAEGQRAASPSPPPPTGDELAVILYTGGTTGVSKGVMLSHAALVVNQELARAWIATTSEDVFLAVLPFFHGFGLSVVLNLALVDGMTIVLHPRFDPGAVLKDLVGEGVTLFAGVPTMYIAMVDHPRFDSLRRGVLRGCFVGADAAAERLKERFAEKSGSVLIEGYGLTEAVTAKVANPYRGAKKPGSVGLPWPDVEARVVDVDTGVDVAPGESGELILRCPDLMMGYWNNEEATREALRDGWLHTGDVAVMDEDGYVFIVDRKKDLIICGGFNVYPTEIEEHLSRLPQVKLSCVIGVPDDYMGEVPKAFVVLREGASLSAERARAFLEERLARYKVPRQYEFRDSLPLTPIGKVSRKELRRELLESAGG